MSLRVTSENGDAAVPGVQVDVRVDVWIEDVAPTERISFSDMGARLSIKLRPAVAVWGEPERLAAQLELWAQQVREAASERAAS